MPVLNTHVTPTDQSQRYAAAESLLQHSRLPRNDSQNINGLLIAGTGNSFHEFKSLAEVHPPRIPELLYPRFGQSYQNSARDQTNGYDNSIDARLSSPQNTADSPNSQTREVHSDRARGTIPMASSNDIHIKTETFAPSGCGSNKNGSLDGSETTSPTSSRDFAARGSHGMGSNGVKGKLDDDTGGLEDRHDVDRPPAWSELKTKAGKERKRLPLACIACRRKKIRCSGEKPACKHCLRSRIPCVYKVTARKAAPRTDYMAMLDKRLKRMEERVIKFIPKEELSQVAVIGRANVRPLALGSDGKVNAGKKRAAAEAFGPDHEEWTHLKANTLPPKGLDLDEKAKLTEGTESLPSKAIQEHLAEVFFEYLYGQSYHLLHKPSFMRRLRAGTVPPVLILAVCAISARFSTHPQVNSEPAFLRGEDWAAPARDIALKRYDEPNITILTVLLILGLHEFGTCQGGRSWMLGGMAMRMAYALQLHRELDHDPLGQKNDKKSELSFTDREIRRRTMWACFLMDRFNSSGTQRPTCANEETIKVQLPIKESHFQMEIPGPTESLDGDVPNPTVSDTGQISNPKDNMGVASYMIRVIALWGRVIKYWNLGGKERDGHPMWSLESEFTKLKQQAQQFQTTLPLLLQNTQENLKSHATEKLANQFLFMHIVSYQVILFLHCFAVPTSPGGKLQNDMPQDFVAEAGRAAIEAADQISMLLTDALDHLVVAPFAGYCAFMSSTVQVWGMFSKNPVLEATSRRNLARNVKYLSRMKKYWGMFHFMGHNLRDIYRQHADASLKGSKADKSSRQGDGIFQYGDWFQKYPHGVSKTDYKDPAMEMKNKYSKDAVLGQKSDLQSVEEFFNSLAPPTHSVPHRKVTKKVVKKSSQATPSPSFKPEKLNLQPPPPEGQASFLSPQNANPQSSTSPAPFSPPHTQVFFPPTPGPLSFTPTYDLLPQMDRHLVYGAYAGTDLAVSPSTSALNAFPNHNLPLNPASGNPYINAPDLGNGLAWNTSTAMGGPDFQQQQQQAVMQVASHLPPYLGLGDLQTSAWFMPFNLNPPDIGSEVDTFGRGAFDSFGIGDEMGGGLR